MLVNLVCHYATTNRLPRLIRMNFVTTKSTWREIQGLNEVAENKRGVYEPISYSFLKMTVEENSEKDGKA